VLPNGDEYEGNYDMGVWKGKFRVKKADGTVFRGDIDNDIITGDGEMTFPNKNKYDGAWANN